MYRWNIKRILLVIPTCCVQPRRRLVDPFNRRRQIAGSGAGACNQGASSETQYR
jgi:hypothetical protein